MATIILRTNSALADRNACNWVREISRWETDAIGFLCDEARLRHHANGLILTAEKDLTMAAFIVHSPLQPGRTVQVHQIMTTERHRLQTMATQLVNEVATNARRQGAVNLIAKCANDLDANAFWRSIGFLQFDQTRGGRRRGRIINHFRLPLIRNGQPPEGISKCDLTQSLVPRS